ncbi:MAG: DUF1801 domain-containing protein [Acidobacteria bacterium]|nr:DUF1801 domain-containing protein [Acidobacteriota bacterium]
MAELKTKPTDVSVEDFLNQVADEKRRADCFAVLEMMKKITKAEPKMWGPSIVGFGSYHYKYASGHEGDSCLVGFASRKDSLVLYLMGRDEKFEELLTKLGKFKSGKGCLYVKQLADVDSKVLQELIKCSFANIKAQYKTV